MTVEERDVLTSSQFQQLQRPVDYLVQSVRDFTAALIREPSADLIDRLDEIKGRCTSIQGLLGDNGSKTALKRRAENTRIELGELSAMVGDMLRGRSMDSTSKEDRAKVRVMEKRIAQKRRQLAGLNDEIKRLRMIEKAERADRPA